MKVVEVIKREVPNQYGHLYVVHYKRINPETALEEMCITSGHSLEDLIENIKEGLE